MDLNISDIQHFSVGDGDGIRTTVFFKGCNLHCPWCHNPETLSSAPQILHYKNGIKDVLSGRKVSVDEVLSDLLSDKDFYDASGGGVTLSGGEVLLQADGAASLAKRLFDKGVSVIVDTAGCVPYAAFQKLNPYTSEYYFDLKAATDEDYRKLGGSLSLVKANIQALLGDKKRVRARIPLIPNFNAFDEYSEKMCGILKELRLECVDLLPFHRLGAGKYDALGLPYAYREQPPLSLSEAEEIAKIYRKYFDVKIEK